MTQSSTEQRNPMRDQRVALGLSLRALSTECRRAGGPVSNSQLSKIERGRSVPRPAARRAITQVLGIDPVTGEPTTGARS